MGRRKVTSNTKHLIENELHHFDRHSQSARLLHRFTTKVEKFSKKKGERLWRYRALNDPQRDGHKSPCHLSWILGGAPAPQRRCVLALRGRGFFMAKGTRMKVWHQ